MRLLLDTHIWVWSVIERQRLSARVIRELEDSETELWLSPLSLWEVFLLCRKRRLALDPDPETWVHNALKLAPLRAADMSYEVARETERFELAHRDPVDKFLVATARVLELTLVTADENLIKAKTVAVFANR